MFRSLYVDGVEEAIDQRKERGIGGQGTVYQISPGTIDSRTFARALKVYHQPNDPRYAGTGQAQIDKRQVLQQSIDGLQLKLPAFPKGLPRNAIGPLQLARVEADDDSLIVGYTMELVEDCLPVHELADEDLCAQRGIGLEEKAHILLSIYDGIQGCHDKGVVLGDANINNFGYRQRDGVIFDLDASQFGGFTCDAFTAVYTDPLLLKERAVTSSMGDIPVTKTGHYSPESDWYSFSIIGWEIISQEHVFGGRHRPKDISQPSVGPLLRPVRGLHIWHPDCKPSSYMVPEASLPSDFLAMVKAMVVDRKRGKPDREILKRMAGLKMVLVSVAPVQATAAKQLATAVTVEEIFSTTTGTILGVCFQNSKLQYMVLDGGRLVRNDSRDGVISNITLGGKDNWQFVIYGERTIVSKGAQSFIMQPGVKPQPLSAERYGGHLPAVAANGNQAYYVSGGELYSNSPTATIDSRIGSVMRDRTRLWVGESFGFGFYEHGGLRQGVVFNPGSAGLIPVNIPPLPGTTLAVDCSIGRNCVWLVVKTKDGPVNRNHCLLINESGQVVASTTAVDKDDSWLGSFGSMAASQTRTPKLYVTTDEGVIEVVGGANGMNPTGVFQGTAGVVSSRDRVIWAADGLYVWNQQTIRRLRTSMV